MMMRSLLAATAAILIATPALANHCPKDAAAIDHALALMSVSADVKAQAQTLRDQGMAEHAAGNHEAAEKTLAEAMRLILMDMK